MPPGFISSCWSGFELPYIPQMWVVWFIACVLGAETSLVMASAILLYIRGHDVRSMAWSSPLCLLSAVAARSAAGTIFRVSQSFCIGDVHYTPALHQQILRAFAIADRQVNTTLALVALGFIGSTCVAAWATRRGWRGVAHQVGSD